MPTTFQYALQASAASGRINFGAGPALADVIQTVIQIVWLPDDAPSGYLLSKEGAGSTGWAIKAADSGNFLRTYTNLRRAGGGASAVFHTTNIPVETWGVLVHQFNRAAGTQACFAGVYVAGANTLAAATAAVDEDGTPGTEAASDALFPLKWGDLDGDGLGINGMRVALVACLTTLPDLATLNGLVDDLDALVATALVYAKVGAAETTPLDDVGTADDDGSFVNLTAVDGPDAGGPPPAEAVLMVDQPSDVLLGGAMYPAPRARLTEADGVTTDTDATNNVTVSINSGTGTIASGTTTRAAVAGVTPAFTDLVFSTAGAKTLKFAAAGFADAISDSFTVVDPAGTGTSILQVGAVMRREIRRNEASAALRRIFLLIFDEAGAAWAGAVLGVKAKLSQNGGAETDSPADIVRVAGALHYVGVTDAYTDVAEGSELVARVVAAAGRLEATGSAVVIPGDAYDATIEQDALVAGIIIGANGGNGWKFERVPGSSKLRITGPGIAEFEVDAIYSSSAPAITQLGAVL